MRKPTGLNFSDFSKAASASKNTAVSGGNGNGPGPAFDIKFPFYQNSQSTGKLKINGEEHDFCAEDLEDKGN